MWEPQIPFYSIKIPQKYTILKFLIKNNHIVLCNLFKTPYNVQDYQALNYSSINNLLIYSEIVLVHIKQGYGTHNLHAIKFSVSKYYVRQKYIV